MILQWTFNNTVILRQSCLWDDTFFLLRYYYYTVPGCTHTSRRLADYLRDWSRVAAVTIVSNITSRNPCIELSVGVAYCTHYGINDGNAFRIGFAV